MPDANRTHVGLAAYLPPQKKSKKSLGCPPAWVGEALADVPKLIPIGDLLFTKCIPATPNEPGNPVFSINQTDVLHAGRDLGDFLHWFSRPKRECERDEESGNSPTPLFSEDYRPVEFCTDVARQNATI